MSNLDDNSTYAGFRRDYPDSDIAYQFGVFSGSMAKTLLENSSAPELLEFHLLDLQSEDEVLDTDHESG